MLIELCNTLTFSKQISIECYPQYTVHFAEAKIFGLSINFCNSNDDNVALSGGIMIDIRASILSVEPLTIMMWKII